MGKRDKRRRRKQNKEREIVNQLEGVKAANKRRIEARRRAAEQEEDSCSPRDVAGTIDETLRGEL